MSGNRKRIILGFVLLIVVATLELTIYSGIVFEGTRLAGLSGFIKQFIVEPFLGALIYAVVLSGVQSVIYSYVMEKLINPKLKNNYLVVCYSSMLGIVVAALPGFVTQHMLQFVVHGAIAGLIVGVVLRSMYLKELKRS